MADGNLLVTLVICLAAYGGFDLLRRLAHFVRERRRTRARHALDEKAWRAGARRRGIMVVSPQGCPEQSTENEHLPPRTAL